MAAANKTLSDSELQNIAQTLEAHNQFLASPEGKIYIALERIKRYEEHYHESLLENRRKEEERRAKLTKKSRGKNKERALKKYLELRPRREVVGNPIYAWFAFFGGPPGWSRYSWLGNWLFETGCNCCFLPSSKKQQFRLEKTPHKKS